MTTVNSPVDRPGRGLLFLGLACAILGIVGYVVQVFVHHLTTPWYLPLTALFGLGLVVLSLREKRSFWRWLVLAVVGCVAAFECMFLIALRLPPYIGPLVIGKPFPAFQTQRADGSSFTQADFKGDKNTVLVFFRGRW